MLQFSRFPLVLFRSFLLLLAVCFSLQSCKVGEDDPGISFRSRDARLKANWKLATMEAAYEITSFDQNGQPVQTGINLNFDGYTLYTRFTTGGAVVADSAFGYSYQLKISDDGKTSYSSTMIYKNLIGVNSFGNDNWFWLNTDEKKSRVNLGNALQGPLTAGFPAIPNNISLSGLISDFAVDGLRNKELKLSFSKGSQQTTITGFQSIKVSGKLKFTSK